MDDATPTWAKISVLADQVSREQSCLRNEIERRDTVLRWLLENNPGALRMCPYKLNEYLPPPLPVPPARVEEGIVDKPGDVIYDKGYLAVVRTAHGFQVNVGPGHDFRSENLTDSDAMFLAAVLSLAARVEEGDTEAEPSFGTWSDCGGTYLAEWALAQGSGYWPTMVTVELGSGTITADDARSLARMLEGAAEACDAHNQARCVELPAASVPHLPARVEEGDTE